MKRWLCRIVLVVLLFTLGGCYSCKTWNEFWGKGPVDPYGAEKPFWDGDCKQIVPKAPDPRPAEAAKPAP